MAYRTAVPPRALLARFGRMLPLLALASCAETDNNKRLFELQFDARIGGQRVACGEPLSALGENGRATTLKDLRFYVHDVQLIDAKGRKVALTLPDDGRWQSENVALLDFEDKSADCRNGTPQTNALVRGTAPAGDYKGITFRVGVPPALNHADPAKLQGPLTGTSLYWSWRQGFIFFRLDLAMAELPADRAGAYELHLGATGCREEQGGYSCAQENTPAVTLDGFDPQRDKVVLDLGTLLADTTVAHSPLSPANDMSEDEPLIAGCASNNEDPDCAAPFAALGLEPATGAVAGAQSAFQVRPRDDSDPGRSETDAGTPTGETPSPGPNTYKFKLPEGVGFSEPMVPADNPMTAEKVELGRHLFYDKRLSVNETQSCASCHKQELAFTDGRAVGLGATGESHIRGSMSLANVVYSTTLTWAFPDMKQLERQARVPLFGDAPVELGFKDNGDELIARLRPVQKYQELFKAAFPDDVDPFSINNVLKAIASFERTLISGNSPYDRYVRTKDPSAISESAKRGADLFFDPDTGGRAFECFHCHGGPTFSDQLSHAKLPSGEEPFHNTGLYNLDIYGSYPVGNQGVYEFSKDDHDRGRFKAPTLRNIAVTAPYMHDGSIATLEEVVAHYARGGRNVETGPNRGDGKLNRNKSEFIHGFASATAQERADLIEFLKSLTDEEFLTNPAFSDPW